MVWHRVRADADVPPGTSLRFRYATVDADPLGQPLAVHPDEWRTAPEGTLDFLIQGLPGRYLALELELSGDGVASPRVRQVRVDFPRVTSGEQLPGVYFEEPESADFTQRFLSLFDAELEELDRTIETFPRWLSVHAAPNEALAWLGGLVGLSFDSQITSQQRRTLLREAPTLFAERGTVRGLQRVLEIVTGEPPALIEPTTAMGALPRPGRQLASDARLSATRLFSARTTRFKVGRSPLGQTKLRSLGNPEVDPHLTSAWRVLVAFPPQATKAPDERRRLTRLVTALEPAHVRATVRFARDGGFVVGTSLVGIDTALVPFAAPRLGANTALSRATVLWPSPTRRAVGLTFPLLTQGANPP
jgi:phage tail-like protein